MLIKNACDEYCFFMWILNIFLKKLLYVIKKQEVQDCFVLPDRKRKFRMKIRDAYDPFFPVWFGYISGYADSVHNEWGRFPRFQAHSQLNRRVWWGYWS